jgi:hypothetical protein
MLHAYVLNCEDIHIYGFFSFLLNCEHTYTYKTILLFDLVPTGDKWVPVNSIGMGLGTKSNPSQVMGFLIGGFYIRGHEFGMTKPNGFVPVAISTIYTRHLGA